MKNQTGMNRMLCTGACAAVCTISAVSSAGNLVVENFEGHAIGTTPPGWSLTGSGDLSISDGENHTGVSPIWSTPSFGQNGDRSLALSIDAGIQRVIAEYAMPTSGMDAYVLDFSMFYTPGMIGTLGVRIYGPNSDTIPVVRYSIDLDGGDLDLTFTHPDSGPSTLAYETMPGIWTEHMLRMLRGGGPQMYFEPSHITYWASLPMDGQNFTRIEFTLDTDPGSVGGTLYIDDLSLSDCPADFSKDGQLDVFDVFAYLDAFNASHPEADLSISGVIDVFDVFAYLESFNAGCP